MADSNDNHTLPPGAKPDAPRDISILKEEYELSEALGSGRFGVVHEATHKETQQKYAAKVCVCRPSQRKEIDLEIEIMNTLRHPRLVTLCDAFVSRREVALILEIVTGGELFDRIIDETFDLNEELAVKYLRQICEGMSYIHDNNILHLDMKPENILCVSPTRLDEIKIIDFGFARRYSPGAQLKVMYGTPEFVAPEVVNFDPLGPGTDMWSIGVITYVMLSGLSPFMGESEQETLSNVTGCEWDFEEEMFDEISDDAKDFVQKLLCPREKQRLSSKKCLEHAWLTGETFQNAKFVHRDSLVSALKNMKKFVSRRKWMRSINAVRAVGRFQIGVKKDEDNTSAGKRRTSGAAARTRELMGV